MHYHDDVYGDVTIGEPVLQALMRSTAINRLRSVLQHGISGLIGITTPVTRFEHSMGVMLLVQQMGGSLQEQIAALLHDVSHTAFSHVIDFVFDGHNSQSYHEEIKERYIGQTDLPALLANYGYDWYDFVDEEAFTLLEQPAPRLCADRLDYFLRDSLELDLATPADVNHLLQHLTVHDGRIVTNDLSAARWLGYTYIAADKASWANFREVGLYELTARAIRRALDIELLHETDLWEIDETVWRLLHEADDPYLRENLALVTRHTSFVWDEENPSFRVQTKLRSVDPDVVLDDGSMQRLSQIDSYFGEYRLSYHRDREGLWPMRVVVSQK